MLAFVPVAFDVYRPLKPRLRWAMQCLVASPIAPDDASRPCGSSPRSPGCPRARCPVICGISSSAVSSPASAALVASTTTRLTRASCRARRCPTRRSRVSHGRRDRKQIHLNRQTGAQARPICKAKSELRRDARRRAKWEARLRSLASSRAFGCRCGAPSRARPGCMVPAALLQAIGLKHREGTQGKRAPAGAFLSGAAGTAAGQRTHARHQAPPQGQGAPATGAAVASATSSNHRTGPPRGRAAR